MDAHVDNEQEQSIPINRTFYSIPSSSQNISTTGDKDGLISYIRESVIGKDKVFSGPFGLRKVVYLDYIASGKSLSFIEDYIRDEVLPEYGNTHTTTNVTSLQTTMFRHEARDIIRNSVNASEHDAVIFTGSGCTAAVHKLIHVLNLTQSPVVFVGPYEHHSNILPWKEAKAKVIRIHASADGLVDIDELKSKLQKWKASERPLIGSFSAASNITGILVDVNAITICLHKSGALALWDYATAAPYVRVDMNPLISGVDQEYVYKDAIFISTHKFIGGVSTPGILVAKKKLFRSDVPEGCGGGTVFFVRRESHRYLQEPEMREEGGTPSIVGSIRAGLIFQLKENVTSDLIMDLEDRLFKQTKQRLKSVENLVILGSLEVHRLPVLSFIIYHPQTGRILHHNYVSTILNDLFGIQARGGCACAGPYAQDLLGMPEHVAKKIEELLVEDKRLDRVHLRRYKEYSHREILRPGFTRINLPYFMDDATLEFVLSSLELVAEYGWKLLPEYMFNPETGEWRQKQFQTFKDRKWLGHINYNSGLMQYNLPQKVVKGPLPTSYKDCLDKARYLVMDSKKVCSQLPDQSLLFDDASRPYRWFLLPSEAHGCLNNLQVECISPSDLPFCPPSILSRHGLPIPNMQQTEESDIQRETMDGYGDQPNSCIQIVGDGFHIDESVATEFTTNFETQTHKEDAECVDESSEELKELARSLFSALRKEADAVPHSREDKTSETVSLMGPDSSANILADDGDADSPYNFSVTVRNKIPSVATHTIAISENEGRRTESFKHDIICAKDNETMAGGKDIDSLTVLTNSLFSALRSEESNANKTGTIHSKETNAANNEETAHGESAGMFNNSEDYEITEICDRRTKHDDEILEDLARDLYTVLRKQPVSEQKDVSKDLISIDLPDATAIIVNESINLNDVKVGLDTTELVCDKDMDDTNETKLNASAKDENSDARALTKTKWYCPPKHIFKPTVAAIEDYSMIRDGDRLLVCLSGGKDSLSLLHTMRQYQFYSRSQGIHFAFGAVTVDPQTPAYDPSPLKQYLASLGVPYFYESQGILDSAASLPYECASICSFCSRMKRGRIYACARREGYNVLSLGQHLDDLTESFLMSYFHNGTLRTMKAQYTVQEGDLRVIRPFVFVREKDLRNFAEMNKLPVISENCPACFEAPKERHRTKQLLAGQELLFPRIYSSMLAAMKPLLGIERTGIDAKQLLGRLNLEEEDVTVDAEDH